MAEYYRIQTFHALAHLQPTLTTGTAVNSNPHGNCRTLDPNMRAHLKGAATVFTMTLDWDRGASGSDVNNVDCFTIAGCTYDAAAVLSFDLEADNDSGFGSTTSLISGGDFNVNGPRMYVFSSNSERYIRLTITAADTTTVWKFGTFSLGSASFLQQPLLGRNLGGGGTLPDTFGVFGQGASTWSRSFRRTASSLAATIDDHWRRREVLRPGNTARDGFGLGAGTIPCAIGQFSAPGDQISDDCVYGYANIRSREFAANYSQIDVTMSRPEIGLIG